MAKVEINCSELEDHFTLSQPTISHYSKILYDCGLIHARKNGQHSMLSVNKKLVEKYLESLKGELVK